MPYVWTKESTAERERERFYTNERWAPSKTLLPKFTIGRIKAQGPELAGVKSRCKPGLLQSLGCLELAHYRKRVELQEFPITGGLDQHTSHRLIVHTSIILWYWQFIFWGLGFPQSKSSLGMSLMRQKTDTVTGLYILCLLWRMERSQLLKWKMQRPE